jgi:hypothetical protein
MPGSSIVPDPFLTSSTSSPSSLYISYNLWCCCDDGYSCSALCKTPKLPGPGRSTGTSCPPVGFSGLTCLLLFAPPPLLLCLSYSRWEVGPLPLVYGRHHGSGRLLIQAREAQLQAKLVSIYFESKRINTVYNTLLHYVVRGAATATGAGVGHQHLINPSPIPTYLDAAHRSRGTDRVARSNKTLRNNFCNNGEYIYVSAFQIRSFA